jgi:hypothetical protein
MKRFISSELRKVTAGEIMAFSSGSHTFVDRGIYQPSTKLMQTRRLIAFKSKNYISLLFYTTISIIIINNNINNEMK